MEILDGGYGGKSGSRDEWFAHFEQPKTDYSVNSIYYEEVRPTIGVSRGMTQMSFVSEPCPNFTDLAETKLEMTVRLLAADGTNLPPAVPPPEPPATEPPAYYSAGFVQNPGGSLFKNIEIRYSDVLVSSMQPNYALSSYLSTLLFYNFETRNSVLEKGLYFDENDVTSNNPFEYSGWTRRYELTKESKLCYIQAPIFESTHTQSRLQVPMIKMAYTFYLSDPAFCINSHQPNTSFSFEITEARLVFKRVKVLPSLQNDFEQRLSRQNALYPLYVTSTKRIAIGANLSSFSHQNVFSGDFAPRSIICGLISQTDLARQFHDSSPFAFKSYNLTEEGYMNEV